MTPLLLAVAFSGLASLSPNIPPIPPHCSDLQENQFLVESAGIHDEEVLYYLRSDFESNHACLFGGEL